jgi:hypothetical protein
MGSPLQNKGNAAQAVVPDFSICASHGRQIVAHTWLASPECCRPKSTPVGGFGIQRYAKLRDDLLKLIGAGARGKSESRGRRFMQKDRRADGTMFHDRCADTLQHLLRGFGPEDGIVGCG